MKKDDGMKRVLFKVNGIRNNTDKVQLKKALDKIDGIGGVAVNPVESSIEVEYNPPATQQEIQERIESTGHEVTLEELEE